MQNVKLVGNIAQFGDTWQTDCANIRDIFKLIECQSPKFRQYLLDAAEAGVGYEIQKGKEFLEYPEELFLNVGEEDIIITEVPAGSKGGVGKILAAVAIIVATVVTGGATLAAGGAGGWAAAAGTATAAGGLTTLGTLAFGLAVNLAMSGLTELLAPGPEVDKKQEEGYLFNGPENNVQQGLPVPVCYGELRVGGAPISTSFRKENGSAGNRTVGSSINYGAGTTYIPAVTTNTWASSYEAVPEADPFAV